MSYNKYYSEWAESPLSFWDEKAKDISWIELYKKTLHKTDNYYEWFHQGKLNTCYNCVDKHVKNGKSEKGYLRCINIANQFTLIVSEFIIQNSF